ncbi:MAG TPA: histidine kinase [Rubrivivax sp.]|nr:histidine kinase [Rubrivivax sp.]
MNPTTTLSPARPGTWRSSWRSWIGSDLDRTGPAWMQWLWTLLFAAGLALVFSLIGLASDSDSWAGTWPDAGLWWRWYRVNLAITLTISVLIHLMFATLIPLVGPGRIRRFGNGQRALFFSGIPILGVLIGWPLGIWLVSEAAVGWVRVNPAELASSAVVGAVFSFVVFLVFNAKQRQVVAEKRATEAQLRLLQAQIEPHFLFNTLANVQALIDHEPAKAKQMLTAFTDYLRAGLSGLRRDAGPLADELALAEAYLRVQQSRMEDRLHYVIEADEKVRAALLPPLLLQPLVENAVQHGLEPALAGGTVRVRARIDGDEIVIEVHDDGLGPEAPRRRPPGNGVALANIRERLAQRYGDAARLEIGAADPGTLARLRLPLQAPAP